MFALLELLENKEPIDVFSVVRSLKSQRQKFVPRFDFYMLIYKSISLAIQRQFQTTNLRLCFRVCCWGRVPDRDMVEDLGRRGGEFLGHRTRRTASLKSLKFHSIQRNFAEKVIHILLVYLLIYFLNKFMFFFRFIHFYQQKYMYFYRNFFDKNQGKLSIFRKW